MKLLWSLGIAGMCLWASAARGAEDYKIVAADQALPEGVSEEIAATLAPRAFKVTSGKRTLCEIWLRKSVPVQADFAPSQTVLYPFQEGQVVGVIHYPRKTTDYRNQEIGAGVYTLRYGLQPVDGNHVGTSETRDFFLLSPVADDKDAAKLETEDLYKFSREASETTHPAILPMQAFATDTDVTATPLMVHTEAGDLWSVLVSATTAAGEGDQVEQRLLQFVVVGHAPE